MAHLPGPRLLFNTQAYALFNQRKIVGILLGVVKHPPSQRHREDEFPCGEGQSENTEGP